MHHPCSRRESCAQLDALFSTVKPNPSKSTFNRLRRLYRDICESLKEGVEPTDLYTSYNKLLEKYDFDNVVTTGPDGKSGLNWCWGGEIFPALYDSIMYYTLSGAPYPSETIWAIASRNGRQLLLNNTKGEVFEADEIRPNPGFIVPATFRSGSKWGIVCGTGEILIPADYDSIVIDGCLTHLEKDGLFGFIYEGKVHEPRFTSFEAEPGERFRVTFNGEEGYVTPEGEFTTDPDQAMLYSQE